MKKRVGIDIGGTNLRCAIFDENMQIVDKFKCLNDRNLSASENLAQLVEFVLQHRDIEHIGIGCPGPLDVKEGKVLNPPNLVGWDDFKIVEYFEKETGIATSITNDVNAAGYAEALLGAAKEYDSVFFITMSTGAGGAYIYKKELINGISSSAGEIYNMIVCDDKYCHRGVNPGSLNEVSGGDGLARIATDAFGKKMTTKDLFDAYHQGDLKAKEIVELAAERYGKGIANVGTVVDPDVYVIGGSIAIFNPDFVSLVYEATKKYYIKSEYVHFVHAQFGDDAGLIGAALLK